MKISLLLFVLLPIQEVDKDAAREHLKTYKQDLKTLEFYLLDTGHFALEEDGQRIAELMRDFLRRNAGGAKR